MTVRIDSPFATADETADALGVSSQRVKELARLVYGGINARRANGNSRTAPTASQRGCGVARTGIAKRKYKMSAKKSSVASLTTRPFKKSKAIRRKPRRGKKSKASR